MGDPCMKTHKLTVTDNLMSTEYDVPDKAMKPLNQYMERHARLPFYVSVAIFMRHWNMGINLMQMKSPYK